MKDAIQQARVSKGLPGSEGGVLALMGRLSHPKGSGCPQPLNTCNQILSMQASIRSLGTTGLHLA